MTTRHETACQKYATDFHEQIGTKEQFTLITQGSTWCKCDRYNPAIDASISLLLMMQCDDVANTIAGKMRQSTLIVKIP